MSGLSGIVEQVRGVDLERMLGLKPPYPRIALQLDREAIAMVRLQKKRRGPPVVEAHHLESLEDAGVSDAIFEPSSTTEDDLRTHLQRMFERVGARPGGVSLVLPDNLAKISLLSLPERPPSRKQLEEIINFKMRRSVPFRLADASMSYEVLPGVGRGVSVLVALIPRPIIDRFELALEAIGARPGLVDLCTTNLLNLCRGQIETAAKLGGDVALLNSTRSYFSLLILRDGKLIFFRCKNLIGGVGQGPELLAREIAGSLSYYEDKLSGQGLGSLLVRSVAAPFDDVAALLQELPIERVEQVDAAGTVRTANGVLDPEIAQRIAPAVGAAMGRS